MHATSTFDLFDRIAAEHAARPTPMQPALTSKGAAVLAVYRLKRLMAALEPAERADVVGLAVAELGLIAGPAPLPAELETTALCLSCGEGYAIQDGACPSCRPTALVRAGWRLLGCTHPISCASVDVCASSPS